MGDYLFARSGAGDAVPESRTESAVKRNHLQPALERRRRRQRSRRHNRWARDFRPHEGRADLPDLFAERPRPRADPLQEGRDDHRQAAVRRQQLAAHDRLQRPAGAAVLGSLDLHDPADAGRRRQGDGIRQVEGEAFDRGAGARDVRGRRGRRRGQGGPAGDRRIPSRPAEVPEARRAHPARRAAGRPSGHRQDADRSRRRGRSQCAVLHDFRFRLRRNVRGRRRKPRARHVRAGEEERALHHLHRRNRCCRSPPRRRAWRRQRRARADAQPVAGRDGRLRAERRHHHHRGHQSARRARPGALETRPLRPSDRDLKSRLHRPREDPEGPFA